MTIDTGHEKLVPLRDVETLAWLPRRTRGGKLSLSTVYRWAKLGLRGVVLETLSVGGTLCTTETALMRFFERATAAKSPQRRTLSKEQERAQARARTLLESMGVKKRSTVHTEKGE
jgi:hypothetical protein